HPSHRALRLRFENNSGCEIVDSRTRLGYESSCVTGAGRVIADSRTRPRIDTGRVIGATRMVHNETTVAGLRVNSDSGAYGGSLNRFK
ncbi:hypothetical protein A2U01_0072385, partial [Trifolium medium]|nr:hypothetical protein [Trifolium medium]